ncbi:uncharacterized protein LOC104897465 [Beta vulgaris subsp. vulgaris]|uniref:uncharacterized protein LOC104897465 n=1 Tax=Beta vulgaris subsp. vulgaris TaxID=3555 RepID=UPI0025498B91|nr:uncharacterized protein LOC104897465 [Beta vulgaris subsp. vulgaris]
MADLQDCSSQLQITLDFRGLIQAKKDCTLLLHKFLNIEESSLRQKFRVMWLKQALWAIDDDKAPGIDGVDSNFFKKAWHHIKHDIFSSVLYFFDSGVLLPDINYTLDACQQHLNLNVTRRSFDAEVQIMALKSRRKIPQAQSIFAVGASVYIGCILMTYDHLNSTVLYPLKTSGGRVRNLEFPTEVIELVKVVVLRSLSARGGAVSGAGRGCGTLKSQPKKTLRFPQNGIGRKGLTDIQLLHTDTLIKEVEKVFSANHPDPAEVEKAKKVLKEHEQALMEAIGRLQDASDGESDGGENPFSQGQSMDREQGWRKQQYDEMGGEGRGMEGLDGDKGLVTSKKKQEA